jgi:hypothetical protein
MSGELQIIPVCAPQQIDAEIPAAAQIGGNARGIRPAVTSREVAQRRVPENSDPGGLCGVAGQGAAGGVSRSSSDVPSAPGARSSCAALRSLSPYSAQVVSRPLLAFDMR